MVNIKTHNAFMRRALELAQIRQGFTCPNPSVGAVVVKDHKIIAEGFHYAAGYPHAEVEALTSLSATESQGASLYVTLEPCSHYGRTPPCTKIIKEKGIKHVFYGFADPNPDVAGNGAAQLIKVGINCTLLTATDIQDFYKPYLYWCKQKFPYTIGKLAMTLDHIIAHSDGSPLAITGEEALQKTHQMRKSADAILTSAKTILMDNPKLNVRLGTQSWPKPLFILDRQAALTGKEQIFHLHEEIVLFHSKLYSKAWDSTKVTCIHIAENPAGYLPIPSIMKIIGEKGFHSLWVEAGGKLLLSFFQEKFINHFMLYIAPYMVGNGLKAFPNPEIISNWLKHADHLAWSGLGRDGLLEAFSNIMK